jgi:hypothetical protein
MISHPTYVGSLLINSYELLALGMMVRFNTCVSRMLEFRRGRWWKMTFSEDPCVFQEPCEKVVFLVSGRAWANSLILNTFVSKNGVGMVLQITHKSDRISCSVVQCSVVRLDWKSRFLVISHENPRIGICIWICIWVKLQNMICSQHFIASQLWPQFVLLDSWSKFEQKKA